MEQHDIFLVFVKETLIFCLTGLSENFKQYTSFFYFVHEGVEIDNLESYNRR